LKVLITTIPFGIKDSKPLQILKEAGAEYTINPLNKKLNENDLLELISDYDIVLAGTEPYTEKVLDNAPNLKLISRLGIGLDGVNLHATKERGIKVSYTPDAPAPSIAELTLGHIITLLRSVHTSNIQMHNGEWNRYLGKTISESKIGFIGVGRIGTRVIEMLQAFGMPKILANDIVPNQDLNNKYEIDWTSKESIFQEADVISLHVPLTAETKNMINYEQLMTMKRDAALINTSRGGIINEDDLYNVMSSGHLNGVAIDVFKDEPYLGKLTELDNCLLTPHMGSMSEACRIKMELEAAEEAVRFIKGMPLQGEVPDFEYEIQLS
jgi:D-3-phosphoglycerate dehydrogenase